MPPAQLLRRDNGKHTEDLCLWFPIANPNLLIAPSVSANGTQTLAPGFSAAPHPTIALSVVTLTPRFDPACGIFPHRGNFTFRVSLTAPPQFDASRLVLWCYAKCTSCTSSSLHQQCNPPGFYLDPVCDLGFALHANGILTGNVKFSIKRRPRKPEAEDKMWRCASELLW